MNGSTLKTPFGLTLENGREKRNAAFLRRGISGMFLLVLFFCGVSRLGASTWEGVPAGYGLYWSDEFSGTLGWGPTTSNWTYDLGGGGWGNNEQETYTNSRNNSVIVADTNATDGKSLAIIAKSDLTSARIKTQGLQSFQTGYMVARIRIPYGQGIWPAYWMLGNNIGSVGWPACGEIDTMENIGTTSDQANCHGTLHFSGGSGQSGGTFTLPGGQLFHNDYHTFAAQLQNNRIDFYCDGNLYDTLTSSNIGGTWEFNQPNFFIMNVAIGGNWPGPPDGTTSYPQTMLVDYVRVYQSGQPTPTPVVSSAWRIRAGGPSYVDSQGNTWVDDGNFSGGWPSATANSISGALPAASDQALYQYDRYGSNVGGTTFTYTFNVPAGSYQATLKFSENYWTGPGQRKFNVSINGNPVLSDFDIYAAAGGQNKALDKVFTNLSPNVNGQIVVQFSPGSVDQPKVDALAVIQQIATPTPTNTPTVTPTFTPCMVGGTPCTSTPTFTPTSTPTITNTPTITLTPTATSTSLPSPMIWPNPVKDPGTIPHLRLSLAATSDVKIQWFTVSFRKAREDVQKQVPPGTVDIPLALIDRSGVPLANGLYYLVVTTSAGKSIEKILLTR